VLLSAFFSGAEMAFVSVNRAVIREKALEGDRKAAVLDALLKNPNAVISALVIGNNFVNIFASILAGAVTTIVFGNIGIGVATILMMFVVIIFCEIAPKSYAIQNMRFALRIARPLRLITKLFYPLVMLVSGISNSLIRLAGGKGGRRSIVTEKEIMAMMRLGEDEGTIERDEREMVKDVFEFNETRACDLATPKEKIVFIQENDAITTLIQKSMMTGLSRFPVYRTNVDDIVGMVHVKDTFNVPDKTMLVKHLVRPILKLDPSMKADDIVRTMRRQKTHLAVIQSKSGKTLGLLSLEDLVEEIFGEIVDEHDKEKYFSNISETPT
jgi:putative hemolysin